MKYTEFLKESTTMSDIPREPAEKNSILNEQEKSKEKPEDILRAKGFKIRMVTPTAFGTQIDFAKKYDDSDIEKILKGFNIKIKNKSVFIVE